MATHKLVNAVSEIEFGEGIFDGSNKFTIGTETYYLAKDEDDPEIWNMYINTNKPIGDFTNNNQGVVERFKIVPIPDPTAPVPPPRAMAFARVPDAVADDDPMDVDGGSRKKSKKSKSKKSKRKTKGGKKQKKQSKSRKQRR